MMKREVILERIEKKLGHVFQDRSLLSRALTHSSYAHERSQLAAHHNPPAEELDHYERFEFLGDAVLGLAIADLVMELFPRAQEGELSRIRAGLVCCERLCERAQALGLGEAILLGKGEMATGGRDKASILAAAYEAVLAAVYLDGGYERVKRVVRAHFQDLVASTPVVALLGDYKTPLQEKVQSRFRTSPQYLVVKEEGPDHMKRFEVEVHINGSCVGRGHGRSKKEAEQDAARQALKSRSWS
jgi:ribonuclease III